MSRQFKRILVGASILLQGIVIAVVALGAIVLGTWAAYDAVQHTHLALIPLGLLGIILWAWFIGFLFDS